MSENQNVSKLEPGYMYSVSEILNNNLSKNTTITPTLETIQYLRDANYIDDKINKLLVILKYLESKNISDFNNLLITFRNRKNEGSYSFGFDVYGNHILKFYFIRSVIDSLVYRIMGQDPGFVYILQHIIAFNIVLLFLECGLLDEENNHKNLQEFASYINSTFIPKEYSQYLNKYEFDTYIFSYFKYLSSHLDYKSSASYKLFNEVYDIALVYNLLKDDSEKLLEFRNEIKQCRDVRECAAVIKKYKTQNSN